MFYYIFVSTYWFPLPSIIVGIVLFSYYKIIKKSEFSAIEGLLLILLPSYGLGNWIYNNELKNKTGNVIPKKWFIFNYMFKVHIAIAILVFYSLYVIRNNYYNFPNYDGENYGLILETIVEDGFHLIKDLIYYNILVIIGFLFLFIPYNNAKSIMINHLNLQKATNPAYAIKHTFAVRYEDDTDITIYYQFTNLYARRQIVVKDGNITLLSTENPVSNNYKLTDKLLNEFNFNTEEYIDFEKFKSVWNQKKKQ